MRFALIANPVSGRGRTKTFLDRFLAKAKATGMRITFEPTLRPGHAIELGRALAKDHDVLGVAGGDGTIHEVVNGLMPEPIPLLFIPTGSGNDFAKLLNCPSEPKEVLQVLKAGYGGRLDVLETGLRYCVNSVGLGFEALVTYHSRKLKRLRGVPLYLLATLNALRSFYFPDLAIALPSGEEIRGKKLMVSLGNGVSAGGGFYLTPQAYPDDGIIDVCVVESMSRGRMLRLLPTVLEGKHIGKKGIRLIKTESLSIESLGPCHLHIDGEYMGERPWKLTFSVAERRLPVLCHRGNARLLHKLDRIL